LLVRTRDGAREASGAARSESPPPDLPAEPSALVRPAVRPRAELRRRAAHIEIAPHVRDALVVHGDAALAQQALCTAIHGVGLLPLV